MYTLHTNLHLEIYLGAFKCQWSKVIDRIFWVLKREAMHGSEVQRQVFSSHVRHRVLQFTTIWAFYSHSPRMLPALTVKGKVREISKTILQFQILISNRIFWKKQVLWPSLLSILFQSHWVSQENYALPQDHLHKHLTISLSSQETCHFGSSSETKSSASKYIFQKYTVPKWRQRTFNEVGWN